MVVLGRFGSFQEGETSLDDREDYMEIKPSRPRTTDDPGRLWVVFDRTEFYPDDPKRPRDDRKRQKKLLGNYQRRHKTTRYDLKQTQNAFQLPVCCSRSSFFKMAASNEEINAALFMEECQRNAYLK